MKAIVLVANSPEDGVTGKSARVLSDVLGRPVLHHLLRDLQRQNVSEITVISETDVPRLISSSEERTIHHWIAAEGQQFWRAAEESFIDLAQNGADEILVLRVGPYVEMDLDSFLQAHLDNRTHATRAIDEHGLLDLFIMTASRRNEAAYLFRHRLAETRSRCNAWCFRGYWNALETAQHLRCLAVDALFGENSITPKGVQVRPGIWVGRGAQIHPRARLLAPAYVGENAKVRCNAVITRCSVVEHHTEIDFGTVIEDSTVLANTYVGPGLDIIRSVAGADTIASLDHGIDVEIADPRLLRAITPGAARRVLANAAALAAFLPLQMFRGFFSSTRNHKPAELAAAVSAPSALNTPAGFPPAPSAMEASSYHRTWQ